MQSDGEKMLILMLTLLTGFSDLQLNFRAHICGFSGNKGQRNRFLHLNLVSWRLYRKPCIGIIFLTIPVWFPGYPLIQATLLGDISFFSTVPSPEQGQPASAVNLYNWNNILYCFILKDTFKRTHFMILYIENDLKEKNVPFLDQ